MSSLSRIVWWTTTTFSKFNEYQLGPTVRWKKKNLSKGRYERLKFEPSVDTLEVCKVRTITLDMISKGHHGFDFDAKFSNFFEISKLEVKVSLSSHFIVMGVWSIFNFLGQFLGQIYYHKRFPLCSLLWQSDSEQISNKFQDRAVKITSGIAYYSSRNMNVHSNELFFNYLESSHSTSQYFIGRNVQNKGESLQVARYWRHTTWFMQNGRSWLRTHQSRRSKQIGKIVSPEKSEKLPKNWEDRVRLNWTD